MQSLKVENYVLFGRENGGLKPGTLSLRELWGLLQRSKEEPGYTAVFATNTRELEHRKITVN